MLRHTEEVVSCPSSIWWPSLACRAPAHPIHAAALAQGGEEEEWEALEGGSNWKRKTSRTNNRYKERWQRSRILAWHCPCCLVLVLVVLHLPWRGRGAGEQLIITVANFSCLLFALNWFLIAFVHKKSPIILAAGGTRPLMWCVGVHMLSNWSGIKKMEGCKGIPPDETYSKHWKWWISPGCLLRATSLEIELSHGT